METPSVIVLSVYVGQASSRKTTFAVRYPYSSIVLGLNQKVPIHNSVPTNQYYNVD